MEEWGLLALTVANGTALRVTVPETGWREPHHQTSTAVTDQQQAAPLASPSSDRLTTLFVS